MTALTQKNLVSDKLLFDVDQVNVSMLYHDEEDKQKVTTLPELEREMILATRIDQIKEIAEMNIAIAGTRRHSKVAESEISGNKSPSSQRSSRISKVTLNATATTTKGMDSMEICLGQSIVNDFGEVGRVVGFDSKMEDQCWRWMIQIILLFKW